VIVTGETTPEAERLLFDTTVFWVVKPQLSGGNISGLDTLLSGSYVAMRPHEEGTGKPKHQFVGLEDPPILQAWTKGTTYKLETKRVGSISPGSPIRLHSTAYDVVRRAIVSQRATVSLPRQAVIVRKQHHHARW